MEALSTKPTRHVHRALSRWAPRWDRASYRHHPSRSLGKVPHAHEAHSSRPRGRRTGPQRTAAGAVAATASLPLLDRAAKGKVDQYGGATRLRGDQSQLIARLDQVSGKAKNVILVIGDGMGDSEITVARNYLEGAGGAFKGIDALPLTGQMTHYSVNKDTGKPDYTPDSAATGTAWATGVKTYDNADLGRPHGQGATRPCWSWPRSPGWPPATSPPPRSRTRPRPCRSATSASAPATARWRPRRPAPRRPRRTAGAARSASSCSTPVPTSPWAAVRPPSPRPPRPAGGRARRSSSRRRRVATTT